IGVGLALLNVVAMRIVVRLRATRAHQLGQWFGPFRWQPDPARAERPPAPASGDGYRPIGHTRPATAAGQQLS
ncbi:hypothetical protein AB0P40_44285, partial [Streptomyces sp. NPDC079189]|uniref:hypothetical protein n=1 Tax=Streptomyces sp. NPDC079189 TaxID=3154514 RepID=UPI0034471155